MTPTIKRNAYRAATCRVADSFRCKPVETAEHLFALGIEALTDGEGADGLNQASDLFLRVWDDKLRTYAPDLVPSGREGSG